MQYWILKNSEDKIIRSGFENKPVDAWYEHDTLKYTIEDCELVGTEFQKKVWQAIASILVGETKTYGELQSLVGGSAQSVGTACGKNKIPVVIPCHRVVGKKNKLAYSGGSGAETKRELLKIEGVVL